MFDSQFFLTIGTIFLIVFLAFLGLIFSLLEKKRQEAFSAHFDYVILTSYAAVLLLYISPFNHFKIGQIFLLTGFTYTSPIIILGYLIYWWRKKQFKRIIILLIGTVLLSVVSQFYAYDLRKVVLEKTIHVFYCPVDTTKQSILGGIYLEGQGFVNDTICVSPICAEERFSCK